MDFFASFYLIDTINHLTRRISTDLLPSSENADISTQLKFLNGLLTDIRKLAINNDIQPETIPPIQEIIKKLIPKEGEVKLNLGIDSLDTNLRLLQYWHQISRNPKLPIDKAVTDKGEKVTDKGEKATPDDSAIRDGERANDGKGERDKKTAEEASPATFSAVR
jgi:hypothetical protein